MSFIEKGSKAPLFEGKDQHGKWIRLRDLSGKKVVLYFYPKDDTPGCTAETCNLRDNYTEFIEKGYVVIGVSPDGEISHKDFAEKYNIPFSLLSDTRHSIAEQYGTWVEKSMYGRKYMGMARITFVINEEGIVETVIRKVNTKNHSKQLLAE